MSVFLLPEKENHFPPVDQADPDGLLAVGGDLSVERLLTAYREGIFPWFGEMDPLLWWAPDPRFVLFPGELKVAKSMRPYFNQGKFTVTLDNRFEEVMRSCADIRSDSGTWITDEMVDAYTALHSLGYAHSVEVWESGELVGGLYGISIGKLFFGESMFAKVSNASKYGFITLVRLLEQKGFRLIDCQQETAHLGSLGARPIARDVFSGILKENETEDTLLGSWSSLFD